MARLAPNPFIAKLWELLNQPESWDYIRWTSGEPSLIHFPFYDILVTDKFNVLTLSPLFSALLFPMNAVIFLIALFEEGRG